MSQQKDNAASFQSLDGWENWYQNAPCGFMACSHDGLIQKVNKTLLDWLGYEEADLLKRRRFQDLLPIGGKIFYEIHHAPIVDLEGSVKEINYDMVCQDRTRIPVLVSARKMTTDTTSKFYIQYVVFPFSDRKKYEFQLLDAKKKAEVATKAKSYFLSVMSHEIRTPLNSIIGVSDLLLSSNPRPDQLDLLNNLDTSSKNLLGLINNILDLSAIESGKVKLIEKVFDLGSYVRDLLKSFYPQAQKKGIELKLKLPKSLPKYFNGDPLKIGQVLTNLIGNAIKFTSEGFVQVSIQHDPGLLQKEVVHFKIKDTGIGIAPENIKKILEPFSQAEETIHSNFGGTGLGLSISQKILALYGSQLEIKSVPEKGSTFSFSIDIEKAMNVQEDKLDSPTSKNLEGLNALVVDDNQSNLLIASKYLERWKVKYKTAISGEKALKRLKKRSFDFILLDIQMPEMDGFEVARRIRKIEGKRFKKLPIIALTAAAQKSISNEMREAGFDALVNKPFNATELFQVIERLVNSKKKLKGDSNKKYELNEINEDNSNQEFTTPDIQLLEEIFDGDQEGIHKYLLAATKDLEIILNGFKKSINEQDLSHFRSASHQFITMAEMFGQTHINILIEEGKKLFSDEDFEGFKEKGQTIIDSLNALKNWIHSELKS